MPANTKTAIKSAVSRRFIDQFAVQSLFLSALMNPKEGHFDQEVLGNGLKILINTLAAVRRFDPAFAQDKQFIQLGEAIRLLAKKLPVESHIILKRASNSAKAIVKRVQEQDGSEENV